VKLCLKKLKNKMKIFNTKTRKIEDFKPLKSDKIKVYYCGPTVYNYAHI